MKELIVCLCLDGLLQSFNMSLYCYVFLVMFISTSFEVVR